MSTAIQTDLRYPVGNWTAPDEITDATRQQYIADITAAPGLLKGAVTGLSPEQLDTAYRPGGWTVRQVVHHFADSHMNAYCRFKWALTEDAPTIKPYNEADWAELPDSHLPVEISLRLFDALHHRWLALLHAMTREQWARTLRHPERGTIRLDTMLSMYAWHSRHHVAHITELRKRMGWK
jgi:DinB family protein